MRKIIGLFLVLCFPASAMSESTEQNINPVKARTLELSFSLDGYKNMCQDIILRHKNNTLRELYLEDIKPGEVEYFYADIDNDGQDEKLRHKTSRTYIYIVEILDGKSYGLPMMQEGSAFYSGENIFKYNDKYFLIHFDSRKPAEVQKLTRQTAEEIKRDSISQRYKGKTICKFD